MFSLKVHLNLFNVRRCANVFQLVFGTSQALTAISVTSLASFRSASDLSATMESSLLAWLNAALFVMQIVVNVVYASSFAEPSRVFGTPLTPAVYSLGIWVVIYLLEGLLVLVDLVYPVHSLYAGSSSLRICFTIMRLTNPAWVIAYTHGFMTAATVLIFVLLVPLSVLYVYAVRDRLASIQRGFFDPKSYIYNELPVAVYFGWVLATAISHLAMALQHSKDGHMTTEAYVAHVCVVLVVALVALLYTHDMVLPLVSLWFLIAIWTRPKPSPTCCVDISVAACACEGVIVLATMLVAQWIWPRRFVDRKWLVLVAADEKTLCSVGKRNLFIRCRLRALWGIQPIRWCRPLLELLARTIRLR